MADPVPPAHTTLATPTPSLTAQLQLLVVDGGLRLVVGIIISASLLLFRPQSRSSPLTIAATPIIATPGPTARTQANGLEATIHLVTPGPYFLSELLLVDVSLANHTRQPLI